MDLVGPPCYPARIIHVAAHCAPSETQASELRRIVRREMEDPEVAVTVVALRGLWRSDRDPPADASQ